MKLQDRSEHRVIVRLAALGLFLVAAAPAVAQLQVGFEAPDFDGSADGVSADGQAGWYTPNVAGTQDQYIYTYADNSLGLPTNAGGEDQFLGVQVFVDGSLARAQLDFDWSTSSVWTVSYDLAGRYNGFLPASDNLGSFSLQNSVTDRSFIALDFWVDIFTAQQWNAHYIAYDAAGVVFSDPQGNAPGPEWEHLAVDHWYRESTTFDLSSNQITSCSITDLDTGTTTTVAPVGWYLQGGASGGGLPAPRALRFFVGGDTSTLGNTMGWDNLAIESGGGQGAPTGEQSRSAQSTTTKQGTKQGSITN